MSPPIRLAIVHYHLKRGGVTRVIESTLRGLDDSSQSYEIVVIAGEVPSDFAAADRAVAVPGLRYTNAQTEPESPESLLESLKSAAIEKLGSQPDLWHIHNHSLGKNAGMAYVVSSLAQEGAALLLQMHDFAEDGRPANYQLIQSANIGAEQLYPLAARVHYGVINQRDYEFFQNTGLRTQQLHTLPNPVEGAEDIGVSKNSERILEQLQAERLVLYPVRAVRRKNFGEMLLWAACAEPGTVFANTLGPTNINYQAAYEDWRAFSECHGLPVRFSIAEVNDWTFPEMMSAADTILSTSIAEGFGLAFLEPWLFGKSIIGRDLPEITADFKKRGLDLDALYSGIFIPETWFDSAALKSAIATELENSYKAYGLQMPVDAVERALSAISSSEGIDFGGLNEALQKQVIEYILQNEGARMHLESQFTPTSDAAIQHNTAICQQAFSLTQYAESLSKLYQHILDQNTETVGYLDPSLLLDTFLRPESFRLLRT